MGAINGRHASVAPASILRHSPNLDVILTSSMEAANPSKHPTTISIAVHANDASACDFLH
jgi:hypothetical protein